jgi:hypothetical protein
VDFEVIKLKEEQINHTGLGIHNCLALTEIALHTLHNNAKPRINEIAPSVEAHGAQKLGDALVQLPLARASAPVIRRAGTRVEQWIPVGVELLLEDEVPAAKSQTVNFMCHALPKSEPLVE